MIQSCYVSGSVSPRLMEKKRGFDMRDRSRIDDQFMRISSSLISIISNLDALSRILEELEDDPLKASKKQMEFSTRFTRNYLCELRQKMSDIRKHLEHSEKNHPAKDDLVLQCFTSSFQTALQAYQNIEKNLKYVVFNKLPSQISEFLNCFSDLCVIINAAYWESNCEKLHELEDLNLTLINKLSDIENNMRRAEIQKKEKQKTILRVSKEAKKQSLRTKEGKSLNYSMYKSNQVKTFEKLWKKKTRTLAETRFGNKPEFQINTENEDSPNDKAKEKPKDPIKIEPKKEIVHKRKQKPVPENEMETMVQSIENNSDISDNEIKKVENQTETDNKNEEIKEVTNEVSNLNEQVQSVEELVGVDNFNMGSVLDEAFRTMFNHIMSQVLTNMDPENKETEEEKQTRNFVTQEVKRSNFREDNVKLICIVEDETSGCVEVQN